MKYHKWNTPEMCGTRWHRWHITHDSTNLIALRHPRCAIVVAVCQAPILGTGNEAPLDEQIVETVESGCGLEATDD